jgi:hypothetical protein
MAILRIDNFGGEIPRLPIRSLPPGAAQVNRNLLATATEFRPLQDDTAITSATSGATTLYRLSKGASGEVHASDSAGWITEVADKSCAKGQIHDDGTERTYVSFNDGSAPPRMINSEGMDRLLGIPAPSKPLVARLGMPRLTRKDAAEWLDKTLVPEVAAALRTSLSEDQLTSRFTGNAGERLTTGGFSGKVIAGVTALATGQTSAIYFQVFPTYPLSQRGVSEPWHTMVRIPAASAPAEGLGNPQLGGTFKYDPTDGSTPMWIPFSGLPLWGVMDKAALTTKLTAVRTPRDASKPLWTPARVTVLTNGITNTLSTDSTALNQKRTALDAEMTKFLKAGESSVQNSNRPYMPLPPPSVGDQYTFSGSGENSGQTLNPAWADWNEANKAYLLSKAAFDSSLAEWKAKQASYVATMVEAQKRATTISHEIEALYVALKAGLEVSLRSFFLTDGFERTDDISDGLVVIDPDGSKTSHFYIRTWVTDIGEESGPSQPSDLIELEPGDVAAIKAAPMPGSLTNGRSIKASRLYRSNAGSSATAFQLVAEISTTATLTMPDTAAGLTTGVVTGIETTGKWRDVVATWLIYQVKSAKLGFDISGKGVDFYQDTKHLAIGDTVTQSHPTNGYTLTKTWSGSAWSLSPVIAAGTLAGSTDYLDGKIGALLGEPCPTLTWLPPPYRMADTEVNSGVVFDPANPPPPKGVNPHLRGLVAMPNGITVGFIDNFIAASEPYTPYAWPVEYQTPLAFNIVGICAFGSSLVVGTTGNPYLVTGSDSASLSAQILEYPQPCVSRRSMVAGMGGVFYASPDGYCLASNNGVEVVTQGLFAKEDWVKLNPSSIFSVIHDNVLYFWYTGNGGGCYALDFAAKKLTQVDLTATAVFTDLLTDAVFYVSGTQIKKAFSAGRREATWKSGKTVLPAQSPLAWLQVDGDQSLTDPVTVTWYGDEALRHTRVLTNITPVRLPPGRYREHEIEIKSRARVTSVTLAGFTEELKNV